MANLPTVTSPLPRDLQQFLQRVREALDSGGPDAVVTARQLIVAGVVGGTISGGITPIGGTVEAPRAPSGLTASGALASIIVSWSGPQYKGHAYTEIWAHTSDLVGEATLVGMTAGNNFAHNLGSAAVRYYWVRNVNQNGVVSAFNATNGVQGSTGQDPAYLLTLLTDEITSSQLATSLGTRIDLVDAAPTVSGSVNARLLAETQARTTSINSLSSVVSQLTGTAAYSNSTTYATNDLATYNNNLYKAKQSTAGNLPTNTTYWDLVGNYSSVSQVVVANSAAISNTDGRVSNNTSAIQSEQTARTSGDTAVTSQLDVAIAQSQTNSAAIQSEQNTRVTADEAVTSQLDVAISRYQNNAAAIETEATTRSAADDAATAQVNTAISQTQNNTASIVSQQNTLTNADSATSSQVNVIASATQNNAASIESEGTARTSGDVAVTAQINNAVSQTQNNAAAVISEQTTRADADAATASQLNGVVSEAQNNRAAISSEITTRTTADTAVAAQLVGMEATVNNNTAALATELSTRADEDSAVAAQTTGLSAVVSENTAALATESTVRSDADSANAAQTTVISSAVNNAQAAISTEATTRATNDTAAASQITTLQSSVGGNTASISTQQTAVNGLEAQYTVKIDNNGHVAGFGLASELVDGNISSDFMVAADRFSVVDPSAVSWYDLIKITDYGNSKRAVFGSLAFTQSFPPNSEVKIMGHPDGHNGNFSVQGTGSLGGVYFIVVAYSASQPLNTVTTSEASAADLRATRTGAPPFIISTGSTQINGVTVPAGTYINSAMIADATIKNAQINDLTADKITASLLNTVDFYGNTIAGASIYLGGTVTYSQTNNVNTGIQSIASPKVAMTSTGAVFAVDAFTIDNPGGTDATPFSVTNNVVNIDSALIKDGTITNAMIGNTIQSTDFTAGSAGWRIKKNGNAELNNATFRGTLDITGSSGSNRLEITGDTIKVIDSSNVVRVKIGDLS